MSRTTEPQVEKQTELVTKAKRGCTESFGRLVRQYQLPVRAFLASRIGDATVADDLAQEVFLAAITGISNVNHEKSFKAWLFKVARNKSIDYIRARTRRPENQLGELDRLIVDHQAEVFPDADDMMLHLSFCLKQLTTKSQRLVDRYYFQNKSTEQLAVEIGTQNGALRMTLHRIRKTLAECIQKRSGGQGGR